MKLIWEEIVMERTEFGNTSRLKVPGGWVLRYENHNHYVAMTFVPDPGHTWQVELKK